MRPSTACLLLLPPALSALGCAGPDSTGDGRLPAAVCAAAPGGGKAEPEAPRLLGTLGGDGRESWLASPAVVDLDGDGRPEIVLARDSRLLVYAPGGALKWSAALGGRIWASPLVGDFSGDGQLEVVAAARGQVAMYSAGGALLKGFPLTWRDEVRGLAGGDHDGVGRPELVAATTSPLAAGGQRDLLMAWRGDGAALPGFPPNTSGAAGCDSACYVTGGYDQNLAIGPLRGAGGALDVLVGQDNAYLSWHRGDGVAFDASPLFRKRKKVLGVRFLLDYALAQQGYADEEARDEQAHFTNSAPAIADVDGDGESELVVLGSVQNAAQTDRLRGVALFLVHRDGTRPPGWTAPFQVREYLAGLWDFDGTNVVGATNQVAVGDLDPARPGLDLVFAGFDGRVHCVGADRAERWSYRYTASSRVLTGGVLLGDLSGDGVPEVIFASYSPDAEQGALYVLSAAGRLLHRVPLPGRGAMAVPTLGDVDRDGALEIVVSLKDEDPARSALLYTVPGSAANCLLWPTGRGNYLRSGAFRQAP